VPVSESTFITSRDAAKLIGVHESRLTYWRTWGIGPSFERTGRYVLYVRAEVEAWCADPNNDRPKFGPQPKGQKCNE
jgi:hypothetical protein